MGLDIDLIRIVNYRSDDLMFLPENENPELEAHFGHLKCSKQDGAETVAGYYYEEVGYQRKGVKQDFFKRYKPDEFVMTKKELDELTTYIDREHQTSFSTDITQKFIEGVTIVRMGY